MKRREFVRNISLGAAGVIVLPLEQVARAVVRPIQQSTQSLAPVASHVRHGLFQGAIVGQKNIPIIGKWIFAFDRNSFLRNGLDEANGQPQLISAVVGTAEEQKLIQIWWDEPVIRIPEEEGSLTYDLNNLQSQVIWNDGEFQCQIHQIEAGKSLRLEDDCEQFIYPLKGEVSLSGDVLTSNTALFLQKKGVITSQDLSAALLLIIKKFQ